MTILEDLRRYEAAHPRPPGLGPSDAGQCRRALAYRERGEPTTDEVELTQAALGTAFDAYLTGVVWPYLYPNDLYQLEVNVPGLPRRGRLDRYRTDLHRVVDLKTSSDRAHARVEADGAWDDNVEQLDIYALCLARAGHDVAEEELLYVNRSTGGELSYVWAYDPDESAAALERLLLVDEAIRSGAELPRDRSGPGIDVICDRYCPWKTTCWDLPNVPADRSPQSHVLTLRDADVEQAAALYDEARAVASKAAKAKDLAKARLVGVEGRFGEWEVTWGREKVGKALDEAAVRALCDEYGVPVPEVDTFRAGAISVKRRQS